MAEPSADKSATRWRKNTKQVLCNIYICVHACNRLRVSVSVRLYGSLSLSPSVHHVLTSLCKMSVCVCKCASILSNPHKLTNLFFSLFYQPSRPLELVFTDCNGWPRQQHLWNAGETILCWRGFPSLSLLELFPSSLQVMYTHLSHLQKMCTHRRKCCQTKEILFSVPFSNHLNPLYWLRYLHFHRPHLDVDDGFQVFGW